MAKAVRDSLPAAFPAGTLDDRSADAVVAQVFGGGPKSAAGGDPSDPTRHLQEVLARKRRLLLQVAVGRVAATVQGRSPYALVPRALVISARRLNRRPLLRSSEGIPGPWNFTVPGVEDTLVLDEAGPYAPGGTFPHTPRLHSDPEGLFYDFREEDMWWPFTRGRWQGDVALGGSNDNLPIRPQNLDSLLPAPVNVADGAGAALAALRSEALRLLHVASRAGVEGLKAYTAEASRIARASTAAAKGDAAAAAAVAKVRETALGGADGLRAVSRRLARLRRDEDGIEGPEERGIGTEFDVAVPGDQAKRAAAFVAWPTLARSLTRMRVLVYEGMAAQAFRSSAGSNADASSSSSSSSSGASRPDAATIEELAARAVDTPWGLALLREEAAPAAAAAAAGYSGPTPTAASNRALELLTAWTALLRGAQPGASQPNGGTYNFDRAPFATVPVLRLDAGARQALGDLARSFAQAEGAVLGAQTGGVYVEALPGTTTPGGPRYTIGATADANTGVTRITLLRADVPSAAAAAAAAEVAAAPSPAPAPGASAAAAPAGASGADKRFIVRAAGGSQQAQVQQQTQQQRTRKAPAEMDLDELARRLAEARASASHRTDAFRGTLGSDSPAVRALGEDGGAGASGGAMNFGAVGRGFQAGSGTGGIGRDGAASPAGHRRPNIHARRDEQPIPTELATTREERSVAEGAPAWWDFDVVLRALTDASGHSVVGLFGLPATGNTLAAGALVVDHFRREADGRIAHPQARSVDEIRGRLGEVANNRLPDGSGAADGAAAAFARETLGALAKAPAGALEATHALIVAAAAKPLDECMKMEYRALARLLGVASSSPSSSLLAPLADPRLELTFPGREAAAKVHRQRAEEQAAWERALESYLASGEGAGVFGDLFRRRYVYFRQPLGSVAFGEGSGDRVVADEEKAARRAGDKSALAIAEDILGTSSQGVGSSWRRSAGPRGGPGRRDEGADELEETAAVVAAKRALSYAAEGKVQVATSLSSAEEARFRSLSSVGGGSVPAFLR
jgi:hypothetical protein